LLQEDVMARRSVVALRFAGLALLVVGGLREAPASATSCAVAALNALRVPSLTVTSAGYIRAANGVPEYCDLKGSVTTADEGAGPGLAGFEIDLPQTWNHKFIFNGGGGFDGSVSPANRQELLKGYATVSTDSGHVLPAAASQMAPFYADWVITAPGVPDMPKLIDYFYRSRHQVGIAAKQLVLAYYESSAIAYSYFTGCSNGGRQALIQAMRYPDDFDGIVSSAPWMDPLGTELWTLKNVKALLKAYIPSTTLTAVEAAVKTQCDAADGVTDGLIQNPAKCSFNPDTLVPGILTQAQADAVKNIIKPVSDYDSHLIYPGSAVSVLTGLLGVPPILQSETLAPAVAPAGVQPWGSVAAAPANWQLATGVISYLGHYDPSVNLNSGTIESDDGVPTAELARLYERLSPDLADDPVKLNDFITKGHKLLLFHGYSDPVISPYRTILFYTDAAAKNGGYDKLQEHVRLFMVPDMLHCSGGSGPNVFDSVTALEDWVERGLAPDRIIAAHYVNNNQGLGTDRTMPLCKFPEQARHTGSGDVNNAATWTCPPLDRSLLEIGPNGQQAGLDGRRVLHP
jgi:feruloyl esterase